jgi:prepilin-type N-terminal cleavage/methylation domain-containing protein
MARVSSRINQQGFSLVEILLAVAVFSLFVTAVVGGVVYGRESTTLAGQRQRAVRLADECQEAVRGIRDGGYSNLTNGTFGLSLNAGHWTLAGASDLTDIFTRSVSIADGVLNQKTITCNVTWQQNLQRSGSVQTVSYLTNWNTTVNNLRNGMLVYGDGGNSTDAIKYQIYNSTTGTWSAAAATADVDSLSSNKYLRSAKLYASPSRNEKVLISRHYNGVGQWIYAQVYNGATNTWGNVVQLATWNTNNYPDVQNFDATYKANGDLMVVYSDNTIIPKSRVWNGASWGSQGSLTTFGTGQIPSYIILRSRPDTNEVMMVSFTQNSRTNSEYYSGSAWSAITTHATSAPVSTSRLADFTWSGLDATKGVLVNTNSGADKSMNINIWTANGIGGGSWGTTSQYNVAQSSNIESLKISPIKGTDNFNVCDKDSLNPARIICMRANTSGWVMSSNVTVSSASDAGIQLSFNMSSQQLTSNYLIMAYSDNTTTAKLKKFNNNTSTWDGAATNLNASAVGVIKTVRVEADPGADDMMILVTDASLDLYSIVWNGTLNQPYSTPADKAWLVHGIQGSAMTDYWYDFVWDGQ